MLFHESTLVLEYPNNHSRMPKFSKIIRKFGLNIRAFVSIRLFGKSCKFFTLYYDIYSERANEPSAIDRERTVDGTLLVYKDFLGGTK